MMRSVNRVLAKAAQCAVFVAFAAYFIAAQTPANPISADKPPTSTANKITQIDVEGLKKILKPNGKPLLVNFWATWCEPCREEFPDLVKIDVEYRGKIDLVTVTLDDPGDIATLVPKFLSEVKAEMPTYLLYTTDENAAINYVSKDWSGNLPMTVLYDASGAKVFERNGKVHYEMLKTEIGKMLTAPKVISQQIFELPLLRPIRSIDDGIADAKRDVAKGKYSLFRYGFSPSIPEEFFAGLKAKYSVSVRSSGCFVPVEGEEYVKGYNQTVISTLTKRHGEKMRGLLAFANQ